MRKNIEEILDVTPDMINSNLEIIPSTESGVRSPYSALINIMMNPSDYDFAELVKGAKRFKDQVIVDIGAGSTASGYVLARLSQAKAYVGVEVRHGRDLVRSINCVDLDETMGVGFGDTDLSDYPSIPYAVVPDDMLHVLKNLPDNSVSLLAGQLDWSFFTDDGDYKERLVLEVERVLHPKGSFLQFRSGIPVNLKKEVLLKSDFSREDRIAVYTKESKEKGK